MPMPKITKRFVDTIESPVSGQDFYRDDELLGFGLRVTRGSKTYIVEGRVRGSQVNRRITLGKHGKQTPEQARRQAKQLLADMANGIHPVLQRDEARTKRVTLAEVRDKYLSLRPLSKHGIRNYTSLLERCLGDWLSKPIFQITREMVIERHRALTRTTKFGTDGKCQANQAMIALNTMIFFKIMPPKS